MSLGAIDFGMDSELVTDAESFRKRLEEFI